MILPIVTYGAAVLRTPAAPVEADSPALQALIDDLIETMRGADGAGLAAPQVGRSLRLFVADLTSAWRRLPEADRPAIGPQPLVCINPDLRIESETVEAFEEGCLSIPGLYEWVPRPDRVTLHYTDRAFQPQQIDAFGPLASVLQHEFDHLDGVLHIDRITPLRKKLIAGRLRRMARGDVDAAYPIAPPRG